MFESVADLALADPEAAFWDLACEVGEPVRGLDDAGLVDAMGAWQRRAARDAAEQLRVVARFAQLRAGQGFEFAADEVAAALRLSTNAAGALLDLALTLTGRLPATLAALDAGVIDLPKVRMLAELTRPLAAEQAAAVEAHVLGRAGGQTIGQLRAAVQRAVLRVDPDGAAQRHEMHRGERRVELRPVAEGMAELWALLPAEQAAALWQRIDQLAHATKTPGDPRGIDERRADVLAELGGARCPCRFGSPTEVHLVVRVGAGSLLGLDDEPAELAGYGPIPADLARRLAEDATWRRLLTDPASGAVLDVGTTSYRTPADLARHVATRDATCRFPGCRQPAARCDLDHVVPFPAGPTSAGNLQCLCRHHHRLKHLTSWRVEQGEDAEITWTSPTGHAYVTHPEPQPPPAERPPPF